MWQNLNLAGWKFVQLLDLVRLERKGIFCQLRLHVLRKYGRVHNIVIDHRGTQGCSLRVSTMGTSHCWHTIGRDKKDTEEVWANCLHQQVQLP